MGRHDQLYRLYTEFDTGRIRDHQRFVSLFPPVDSPAILSYWDEANATLEAMKAEIRAQFSPGGEHVAALAAFATRVEAFTALDLYLKYGRPVNVLVLDVDDTLRTAGTTDNEIPLETLYLLTQLHEAGMPIVICTGQTLENVKGFLIQGLGNAIALSDGISVVYEAGSGVFSPGRGPQTKRLLYTDLDPDVQAVFEAVRTAVFTDAPAAIIKGCHLQGNEFNVTLKPSHEVGSTAAQRVIRRGLVHLLGLLERAAGSVVEPAVDPAGSAAAYFARADPEIAAALEAEGVTPSGKIPEALGALYGRLDVGYYAGDAVELRSLELNKAAGVRAAFDALGIEDPFALVVGDSKSDLRVMEWVDAEGVGVAAAPRHASAVVLEFVEGTDELVFDPGDAATVLRIVTAMDRLGALEAAEAAAAK